MVAGKTLAAVFNTATMGVLGYVEVLADAFQVRRLMNQSTTVSLRFRDTANTRSLLQGGRTLGVYTGMHAGTAGAFNRDMGAGIIQSVKPTLLQSGENVIDVQLRGMSSLLGKKLRFEPLGQETVYRRYVSTMDGTAVTTASAPAGNGSMSLDSMTYAIVGYKARVPLTNGDMQLIEVLSTYNNQITFAPVLAAAMNSGVTVKFFDPTESQLVAPFTKTLLNGAPRNNGGCTLTDINGIAAGDFVSVPMVDGNYHVSRITSLEPYGVENHIEFDARLPVDSIAAGGSVTIYKAVFDIDGSSDLAEGQRIEIELDDGSWLVTLIRKIRSATISLRDYAPSAAAGGNAANIYDYSLPAADDVAQLIAMRPDFSANIEGGSGGTATGTALLPRGDTLLQMLTAMAERNGEFWQDFPQTGVPQKKLSWRKTADATAGGSAPSGVKLTLPGPGTNLAGIYGDDYHGIIDRITKDNQNGLVNRLYPITADNRINLGYCSEAALDYATTLGFSVVASDDLYIPHYLEDATAVAADGVLETTETIGDISLDDTASAVELEAACDQLLFAAINALLQYQLRTFYTIECHIERPLYPGYVLRVKNDSDVEPAVDADFYVIEVTDRLDSAGVPATTVVVSDTLRARRTPANTIARHNQALVQTHLRSTTRVTTSAAGLIRSSSGGSGGGGTDPHTHPEYVLGTVFAAHEANASAHHSPVSALNTGVTVSGQAVGLRIAGYGLEIDNGLRLLLHEDSGIVADGYGLRLSPGTIGAKTVNSRDGGDHFHAVAAASDARIEANRGELLKSGAAGEVAVTDLYANRVFTGRVISEGTDLSLEPSAGKVVRALASLRFGAGFRIETDTANDLLLAPGGRLVVDPVGDVAQINPSTALQTAHFASGYLGSGWQMTYDGELDARYIYADEMHISSLIYDAARVAVGRTLTAQSAAELAEPFQVPAVGGSGTIVVNDAPGLADLAVFEDLDWIVVQYVDRSGGGLRVGMAYGTVESYVDLPDNRQQWLFRTKSTTVAGQIAGAGTVIHGLGKSGDGWHEINAIDAQGPYSTIRVWRGSNPYTPGNIRTVVREGQLSGITGRKEWGIVAGEVDSRRAILSNRDIEIHGGRLSAYQGDGARVRVIAVRIEAPPGVFYVPTGDVTSDSVELTGSTMWQAVDDDPSSANYSDYIQNAANANSEAILRLGGGGSWSGLSQAKVRLIGQGVGFQSDSVRITVQVFTADGSRPLTGETAVNTWSGQTTVDHNGALLDVDRLATSADWVNAQLVVRWETVITTSRESIRLDPAVPSLAVGYPLPGGFAGGGSGLWVGLDGGVYKLRLGDPVGAGLIYDGSRVALRNSAGANVIEMDNAGNSRFAGIMSIGTSGGIWQGTTGSFAAPGNGLKLWNSGGIGRLATFNGGIIQVQFDTAGKLLAGAGQVAMDASGLKITAGPNYNTNAEFKFVSSVGNTVSSIDARYDAAAAYSELTVGVIDRWTGSSTERSRLILETNNAYGSLAKHRAQLRAGNQSVSLYENADGTSGLALNADLLSVTGNTRSDGGFSAGSYFVPNAGQFVSDLGGLDWNSVVLLDTSDVHHGMTSLVHTSTYGALGKAHNTLGGLAVAGYTAGSIGVNLRGYITSQTASTDPSSYGAVMVEAGIKSGTNYAALGNAANLLVVRNAGNARLIIKGNGQLHVHTGPLQTFDGERDDELIRAADLARAGQLDEAWQQALQYNHADLERLGLVIPDDNGGAFVNMTTLQWLTFGAIWQLSERLRAMEDRLR